MRNVHDALWETDGAREVLSTVAAQIREHRHIHPSTFDEFSALIVRAQSPFWDIQIDPNASQAEKDQAHQRMVQLADVCCALHAWVES